ncbi:Inositol-1-monophosphatase [Rhizobium rhizogenes]|jgi:myo-inositol-1(or 4)-monophosphatase|uniref:Inositol-1-monophosphatase n=2 Tax=Rhizobium/Agrobacterium group TaxID=227290 RepID=A0AAE6ELA1_AGRTU|nr:MULTISPECIES: inositol monophosphatase [Rhizobium/Agrobacterium group]AQS65117.1 inositol monophosphatase [Rhizobium rhizogenes]MBO0128807.1 inositol monophosphatase [Agrobacterium sp. OT33]MCA2371340.1 inositol monophosphatase [Agrobacterium tomkonis CIP 111-78]MCZ7444711.1 inositol monophosphatase [Rhizobium rhizogenes]MCZ7455546.1 inositol monophosphatase [Rhizobium rhizogenes]
MTVNYTAILEDMIATTREAGALTLEHFRRFRDIEIGVKGPGDFVSDADRQSETLIRERLLGRYPWGLTGEEFAPVDGSDAEHRWLVDPIDGTTNFIYGQHYTITIALRRGNETICGLVYNPVADEMFTTIKGEGAYLNGERLRVNASSDIALMCVGTGLPTPNLSLYPGAYQRLDDIRAPIGAVRVVGSAANSCAYVACGRLTGYYEETGFVDTAAGILLVEEAGGIVTDWWGRGPEIYERTGTLIVANAATHAYLLERLRGVPPKDP